MTDKTRQRRHLVPRGGPSNAMLALFVTCAAIVASLATSIV